MAVVINAFFSYPLVLAGKFAMYLKEKKATTETDAISAEQIDWKNIQGTNFSKEKAIEKILGQFPYIKKTSLNKYWLDDLLYKKYISRDRKLGLMIIIGLFASIILVIALLLIFR